MGVLTAKDFKVATCQLSIFHNVISLSKTVLLKEVLSKFGGLFTGDPMSFPIPNDAPPDIPRIILTNKSPNIKLEISLTRTNLFRFEQPGEDDVDVKDFFLENQKNYKDYLSLVSVDVARIAGVIQRYAFCETPGVFLARHFCQDRWNQQPFNRPESFELHSHKIFNLYDKEKGGSLNVNSWVRCKSGFRKSEGNSTKIVLVEQDLNTLSDESAKRKYETGEVDKFFTAIPNKFNEIMFLYFPEV